MLETVCNRLDTLDCVPLLPMATAVYEFANSRAGEHAREVPGDWRGKRACDDYSAPKPSFERGITKIDCALTG